VTHVLCLGAARRGEIAGSGMENRIIPEFRDFIDKLIAAPV